MIYRVTYHRVTPDFFDQKRLIGLFDFTARFFAEDGTPFSQDTRKATLVSVYDTRFDNAYRFYNPDGKRVFHRFLRLGCANGDDWTMADLSRTHLRKIWDNYKHMAMYYSHLKMRLYLMQRGGAPLPKITEEFLRLQEKAEIRWVQLAELFCRLHALESLGQPLDIKDPQNHNVPAIDWLLEHKNVFDSPECVGRVEDAINTWDKVGHNVEEYRKTLPPVRPPAEITALPDDRIREILARRRANSDGQRHTS